MTIVSSWLIDERGVRQIRRARVERIDKARRRRDYWRRWKQQWRAQRRVA